MTLVWFLGWERLVDQIRKKVSSNTETEWCLQNSLSKMHWKNMVCQQRGQFFILNIFYLVLHTLIWFNCKKSEISLNYKWICMYIMIETSLSILSHSWFQLNEFMINIHFLNNLLVSAWSLNVILFISLIMQIKCKNFF